MIMIKVEPRYNEDLGSMETTLLWYRVSRYNQGKKVINQGRIQDFHLGGRKRLCASMHITSAEANSLSAGIQGLEALGLF